MTNEITNESLQQLKALAEAASPGPWKGDRYDGTVKYNLLDVNGTPVISGDNGNSNAGPFGIHDEEDEKYLLAAHPATILALIAKVESLAADAERLDWLDKNSAYVGVNPHARTCLWTLRNIFEINGKGFREAIDAAKEKA